MNRIVKVGFAALAFAVAAPVFAGEAEATTPEVEVEEGVAIGWTPFAIGLISPVQLPWGSATWDVYGLDLGLLYMDTAKVYGLGVNGIASRNRDDVIGLYVSGLCNYSEKDVYGIRTTLGINICKGEGYGLEAAGFSYRKDFKGVDCNFLGAMQDNVSGVQLGGLANVSRVQSFGLTGAIGVNIATTAYGCQAAGIFNMTEELHGAQIGVVNFAEQCPWGFQIGLVNIIMDNTIKVLPIVNGYF